MSKTLNVWQHNPAESGRLSHALDEARCDRQAGRAPNRLEPARQALSARVHLTQMQPAPKGWLANVWTASLETNPFSNGPAMDGLESNNCGMDMFTQEACNKRNGHVDAIRAGAMEHGLIGTPHTKRGKSSLWGWNANWL